MAENILSSRGKHAKLRIESIIAIVAATRRSSNRVKNCDVIVRNTLLVDRMCTFIDASFTLLGCFINSVNEDLEEKDQIPREKIDKWLNLIAQIDQEWTDDMTSLIDYIQQPMFSPDHPRGVKLMQKSKQNFSKKVDCLEE